MICLVTDRRCLTGASAATDRLIELIGVATRAGVDLIQIRERDLSTADLVRLVGRAVEAARTTTAKIVVNDRLDVALAAGADGVHLRSDSIDASAARALVGPKAIVGRSVHSADEAIDATRAGGLDYLIFGTLFDTPSKPPVARPSALDELSSACRAVDVPVLAIGGMTVDRVDAAARAGAAGIAAIRLFVPPSDTPADRYLRGVVGAVRRSFDTP
jgi:thiamine-phosphate pyrophosphorylase